MNEMFGKPPEPVEEEVKMPPLGTITVRVPAPNTRDYADEVWEGHQIEFTEVGGVNIHRYYQVSKTVALQKLVVGYSYGEWQRITQKLDVVEFTEPGKIIH